MNNKNYHFKQNSVISQTPFTQQIKQNQENQHKPHKPIQATGVSSSIFPVPIFDNKIFNNINHNNPNNIIMNNINHLNKNGYDDPTNKKITRDSYKNESNFIKQIKPNLLNNNSNNNIINQNFAIENINNNNSPNFNVTKNKFLMNFNPPNIVNPQDRVIVFGQDKSENAFKKTLRKPAISNLIQNSSLNILNPNPVISNSSFSNSFRGSNGSNPSSNGNYGTNSIDQNLIYGSAFNPYQINSQINPLKIPLTSPLPASNYPIGNGNYNINSESNSINSTTSNSKESTYNGSSTANTNSLFVKEASCVKEISYKEDPNYRFRGGMEDMAKCIDKYMGNSDVGLFTLYDGHGGAEIAQYLKNRLPELFTKILSPLNNKFETDDLNYDIENSINILFNKLDDEIKLTSESEYMGSTAVIVLICKEKDYISPLTSRRVIYCANVGDSRCVLVSNFGVKRLSYDHKASDIQEINRVNTSGGLIFNGRVFGQLIITRAFGDHSLKRYGVIVTPHITKHFVSDKDKYLILASDGIWDVIMDDELLKLSQSVLNADEFSKLIIKTALLRGSQDNMSCIVLKL